MTDSREKSQGPDATSDIEPGDARLTTGPPFVCPQCGARSHHPTDAAEGYCGRCHAFTADEDDDAEA